MTLTWLGHACFLLESGGYRLIVDPFKGVPGFPHTAGEADAVYCSHDHFDHSFTRRIILTEGKDSPFTVGKVSTFHDDRNGALRGENTVHIFTAEGISAAHLGDLGHPLSMEQLAAIGRCDVLLLPIGGTYTLDCATARQVADSVHPRVICPMHYRRGETGFEVLQTAEEFAAMYPADAVHWLDGRSLELNEETLSRGGVVFFQP